MINCLSSVPRREDFSNDHSQVYYSFSYLVVLYYQATKAYRRMDTEKARDRLEDVKERYGIGGDLEKEKEKMGLTTPRRN